MSPSDILTASVEAALVAFDLIIIYRALTLRRALVDAPYRTRAIWTAVGTLSVIFFWLDSYVDSVFGETPTTYVGLAAEGVVWGFTFLTLFCWIAVNVNVAIDTDFFHRDSLGWKKGGGVVALVMFFLGYGLASFVPPWLIAPAIYSSLSNLVGLLFGAVSLYAIAVLFVSYRRLADRVMKTYTKWVVLSVSGVFLLLFFSFLPEFLTVIPIAFWMYCMYRTVGSLAIRTKRLESA